MAGVDLFRIFALLKVISPLTMVHYASCADAYRVVATLVGYPLDDGEGVSASFLLSKEVKAAVVYCCVPSLQVQGETRTIDVFGAYPGAVLAVPPSWGKFIWKSELDQATELNEAKAPVDSPQMQWWVRFVLPKLLAEGFPFFKDHIEDRLQEMLELVAKLVERRGLYWQPEVQRMDGIIMSGWLRTTCFTS